MPGCRKATRRPAPRSRPSSPRPTTKSRSWWWQLAHDPEKHALGLDPGVKPGFGQDHAQRKDIMTGTPGILAIWNDCAAGHEAEFEAWFQGEHLLERLAVPGFLFGRRHQAISGSSGYFAFYLVEQPVVLTSKPYLE